MSLVSSEKRDMKGMVYEPKASRAGAISYGPKYPSSLPYSFLIKSNTLAMKHMFRDRILQENTVSNLLFELMFRRFLPDPKSN